MRYRELTEAPIEDFSVVGDKRPGEQELWWTKQDIRQIDKLVKRREIWKNNPYKFNQVLFIPPKEDRLFRLQDGPVSPEDLYKKLENAVIKGGYAISPKELHQELLAKHGADRITIIHGGNESDEQYMPMTSWILAHRSAHTMIELPAARSVANRVRIQLFANLLELVDRMEYGETNDMQVYMDSIQHGELEGQGNTLLKHLNKFFTFSAARHNKTTSDFELFYDIIAQFLVTGRVKLNTEYYDDPEAKQFLEQMQKGMNKAADRFVRACLGHIFIM
jgi:hypothetical protein